MTTASGRAPTGQATRASPEPVTSLGHTASVLRALIERCEAAVAVDRTLDRDLAHIDLARAIVWRDAHSECTSFPPFTSSFDAALTLLPRGADWRRLTSRRISAHAANPYNANAQKRLDGYGATPALQMCAAALKVRLEPILKALATEARRAETTGSACEGAGPKDNAQSDPAINAATGGQQ